MGYVAIVLFIAACSNESAPPRFDPVDSGDVGVDAQEPLHDAGQALDAGTRDAAAQVDATEPDAGPLCDGTHGSNCCDPLRDSSKVAHTDCAPYARTPVCDVLFSTCVAPPEELCDACRTTEECNTGAMIGSECVTVEWAHGDSSRESSGILDRACLWPCANHDDCRWMYEPGSDHSWYCWPAPLTYPGSRSVGAGYCLPQTGYATCRNPGGVDRWQI